MFQGCAKKNVCFIRVKFWAPFSCLPSGFLQNCLPSHRWPTKEMTNVDQNIKPSIIWVFPKIMVPPNHPFIHRVFHYKPSILGYPYFWKHPFCFNHLEVSMPTQLLFRAISARDPLLALFLCGFCQGTFPGMGWK